VDPASSRRIADNGCGRRPGIRRRQACRYKFPPCVRIAGDFWITASGKIRTVDMPKDTRDAREPPARSRKIWRLRQPTVRRLRSARIRQRSVSIRRNGVSSAITLRHDICTPAGGSRRSSRAGDGGCDGPAAGGSVNWAGPAANAVPGGGRWAASGRGRADRAARVRDYGTGTWSGTFFLWRGWDREIPRHLRGRIPVSSFDVRGLRDPARARPEGVRGPLAGRGPRQGPGRS
jgi:hypothetical protein